MPIFKMLGRSNQKAQDQEKQEAAKKKTALRLAQITETACRRGLYDHSNCSPYEPCFSSCPIATNSKETRADDQATD